MTQLSLPSYQELLDVLNHTTQQHHPSQVHGLICGIICGNSNPNLNWEELVAGSTVSPEIHELLEALFNASAQQLAEFLFEFDILIPTDDEPLMVRAEALTLWCQGFLTGLKLVKVNLLGREPGEVAEAINDLVEIAKMNYEEVVASEEDETAYIELIEYVRMAVILIYQDMREQETSNKTISASKHLH